MLRFFRFASGAITGNILDKLRKIFLNPKKKHDSGCLGNDYGWSFRYVHKKTLLLYVFFEENGFCCTISINDKGAQKVESILNDLSPEIQSVWNNRYPCGDFGGWIHYSVEADYELPDLIRLISIKVKPKKKCESE